MRAGGGTFCPLRELFAMLESGSDVPQAMFWKRASQRAYYTITVIPWVDTCPPLLCSWLGPARAATSWKSEAACGTAHQAQGSAHGNRSAKVGQAGSQASWANFITSLEVSFFIFKNFQASLPALTVQDLAFKTCNSRSIVIKEENRKPLHPNLHLALRSESPHDLI